LSKKTLRLVFGDQLSHDISSLEKIDKDHDIVLLLEVMEENTYVKHHQQKIAFVLSAMRHFAVELQKKNIQVHYLKLDDQDNTQSFDSEIRKAIQFYTPERLILTEPSEYRVKQKVIAWVEEHKIEIIMKTDTRFLCTHAEFQFWAADKKQLRMEYFYREMRKKYNLLIKNNQPIGGQWNFDKENRRPLKVEIKSPLRLNFKTDSITGDVLQMVDKKFGTHFGSLDKFNWAVNREQALLLLDHFIQHYLPKFGDYQDAMQMNQVYLYHSVLSPYINIGLLNPLEICKKVEEHYYQGHVSINSAEGFIRQIIGWREFIRGIYWLHMPSYAEENFFDATRNLPEFYWNAKTDMNCLHEVVNHTHEYAYSHHIQRLMITGNFALLAGLDPKQVCEWYLIVYADAFEWVELPNTLGMALYGDGGLLASKPYAASGKYIHRMSNFCGSCKFNPNESVGDTACPFNYLYWDFISRNEKKLINNKRLSFTFAGWKKMDIEKKKAMLIQAKSFLDKLS
jgi:deoxyribodipyrimidine photolyase-related protein